MKKSAHQMLVFKTSPCIWPIVFALCLFASGKAIAADVITFYHNDMLGSAVAVTDINGDLCWREDYRPYGEKIKNEDEQQPARPLCGLDDNQRGYTNHVHDKDIGLTYMQARYYDPVVGRFMGIDPVGVKLNNQVSFNRYAYGNNNPYKFLDPDGREPYLGIEHQVFRAYDNVGYMISEGIQSHPVAAVGTASGAGLLAKAIVSSAKAGFKKLAGYVTKSGPKLLTHAPKTRFFKGDEAVKHFEEHGSELMGAFGRKSYNLKDYLNDANHVIKNGTFVPEMNGYVRLIGGQGSAKYGFVGLDRATGGITTFHTKSVSELARKAPSLGFSK